MPNRAKLTTVMNSKYWYTDFIGETISLLLVEKKLKSKALNTLETNVLFLLTVPLFVKKDFSTFLVEN